MYAIRSNGTLLPDRYPSWDEAVEGAQEEFALPPDGDWRIVLPDPVTGSFVPSPVYGIDHAL